MVRRKRLIPAVIAVLAAATLAAAPAAGRRFAPSDIPAIVGIGSPVVSPDGKRAVVAISHVDFKNDKTKRDLELIDLASHARRVLTYERKGLGEVAWSPDGTKLAFTAVTGEGDDARSQIFVMPLDGGDARPVTKAAEGVDQFAWRRDGLAFAYTAADEKQKKKGADRFRDSYVVGNVPITQRGMPVPAHLWTIDASGEHAHQLTRGETSVATGEASTSIAWSGDGSQIVYLRTPNAVLNDSSKGHLMVLDAKTGAERRLTAHAGYESDPLVSPDGKQVAYLHSEGDNQINLTEAYVVPLGGGASVAVSHPLDRAVQQIAWAPSGDLYVLAKDGTHNLLARAAAGSAEKPLDRIATGDVLIGSQLNGAIAKDGTIAFVGSGPTTPPELYTKGPDGAPERISDYNAAVRGLDLASAETVTFATSNGMTSDAVLMKPAGFVEGRKYPLVLVIHGGPTSASMLGFDRFGQMLAARGYLVLEPNYRGSDNHGLAFQRAVRYDPEAGPGKDVMAAVDAVRAKGIVDDKRIAVSGWSYGGIMTAWMVTHYHIWRAAVSGASVDDWITDYATADDSDGDKALFHGSPFVGNNKAEWERASAVNYAKDVTTPLLILSDVGDNRDPYATSAMFYRALLDNKKDVTFRAWPVDGHFPRDPVRSLDVYVQWADYLTAHLR